MPADAEPLTVTFIDHNGDLGAFAEMPSKNIYCQFGPSDKYDYPAECDVKSYIQDKPYGSTGVFTNWAISFGGDYLAEIGPRTEGIEAGYYGIEPQVMEYGHNYYFRDMACSSLTTGLTCWNVDTGHGVFIRRAGYIAF